MPKLIHQFSENQQDSKSQEILHWLQQQHSKGASLTLGCPDIPSAVFNDWLGPRLCWWPKGIPCGKRIGLASSRLGRQLDSKQTWFKMLRTACSRIDLANEMVVTALSTSAVAFAQRAAKVFSLRILRIDVSDSSDLKQWGDKIRGLQSNREGPNFEVAISPRLDQSNVIAADLEMGNSPARDRALALLSDRLLVFHLRRGGNWDQLVRKRLRGIHWQPGSVFLALETDLTPKALADELTELGAVGWLVFDRAKETPAIPDSIPGKKASVVPFPSPHDWPYLTHCTRRRHGPWPRQPEEEYLDDLIFARSGADHSPFAALCRIIQQRKLVASGETIRGESPVVCFSAVPLATLRDYRVFRPHRVLWDFEPYGICIRRDWLQRLKARPVIYGDEKTWFDLPPEERPFFQRQQSKMAKSEEIIDWSRELEWRHLGDVDLSGIPVEAGLVFVPSPEEADLLAEICPWPITIVPK